MHTPLTPDAKPSLYVEGMASACQKRDSNLQKEFNVYTASVVGAKLNIVLELRSKLRRALQMPRPGRS